MKIFPLSEGSFTIDKTKVFVPFNKDTDQLQERSKGSLLVEIQPFAIQTASDIIVIDTGLGYSIDGRLQLHSNLQQHNIDPEDVTIVLLSHLHKDHAGGTTYTKGNKEVLTFPNARYYASEKELNYAIDKGEPSYHSDDFMFLSSSPALTLLIGDSGKINENIEFKISGGHCPYHTVFWIREEDQIIFFGGDVAPQLQQMKSRFIAKYDEDGTKSMNLRTEWWKQSEEEKWTLLFYHDIKSPMIKRGA